MPNPPRLAIPALVFTLVSTAVTAQAPRQTLEAAKAAAAQVPPPAPGEPTGSRPADGFLETGALAPTDADRAPAYRADGMASQDGPIESPARTSRPSMPSRPAGGL